MHVKYQRGANLVTFTSGFLFTVLFEYYHINPAGHKLQLLKGMFQEFLV